VCMPAVPAAAAAPYPCPDPGDAFVLRRTHPRAAHLCPSADSRQWPDWAAASVGASTDWRVCSWSNNALTFPPFRPPLQIGQPAKAAQPGRGPSAESGFDGSLIKPMAPENLLALQRSRDRCVQVYRSQFGHGSGNMHTKWENRKSIKASTKKVSNIYRAVLECFVHIAGGSQKCWTTEKHF